MARKLCPACRRLNAGSATACRCGHAFAETSIVAPRRTTKQCPSCRTEQPRLLQGCGCGHQFEDIIELREELVGRVHVGWSYVAIGALALVACVAIMIVTSGTWLIVSVGGLILALRGLMIRADARSALRDIDDAAGVLPSAKVHR